MEKVKFISEVEMEVEEECFEEEINFAQFIEYHKQGKIKFIRATLIAVDPETNEQIIEEQDVLPELQKLILGEA
jgi:hypothetical protein